jgi:hypothetical protein
MHDMQLDIFEHSRDVMLRNDVLDALQRRDPAAARSAWTRFAAEFPRDDTLSLLDLLIAALQAQGGAAFADRQEVHANLKRLREHIEPAAQRLLGNSVAAAWLLPLWRQLAQRCARLEFRADDIEVHAAPLWLRCGDWPSAAEAVSGIASWRRIPAPLAWMTEARYRLQGLHATWALFAELAWLSPGRFDILTQRLADPQLQRLRRAFDAVFEGDGDLGDLAWLPAWCLTERPELVAAMAAAQPALQTAPERAMRTLVELLGLERQGRQRELIEQRKTLRDLHASLYAAYMRSR